MVKNKPLEAIKLITYDYNDNYLEDQMNKMTRECISILTSLKTEYQKENGAQSGDTVSLCDFEFEYFD